MTKQQDDRFNPDPPDLYWSAEKKMELSRFGNARGSVRQELVPVPCDPEGTMIRANRVKDRLDVMEERGQIRDHELDAAREFQKNFRLAGYDRVKTTNLSGAAGGGMSVEAQMAATAEARTYIGKAMAIVGGADSPMWKALFWIVGHGKSLRDVSKIETGERDVWTGFVKAALYLLGQDYQRRTRAPRKSKG